MTIVVTCFKNKYHGVNFEISINEAKANSLPKKKKKWNINNDDKLDDKYGKSNRNRQKLLFFLVGVPKKLRVYVQPKVVGVDIRDLKEC